MSETKDPQDAVQTIGKLVLFKNALIFENTAYQISNIASMWVADHSYTIKHKFPAWIWICALAGAVALFLALQKTPISLVLLGLGAVLLLVAGYGYKQFKPETPIAKFALGIELNSGRRSLFTAPDMEFVQKAAHALLSALSGRPNSEEKVVINFTDRRLYVEQAEHSVIINGDVSGSLVENV